MGVKESETGHVESITGSSAAEACIVCGFPTRSANKEPLVLKLSSLLKTYKHVSPSYLDKQTAAEKLPLLRPLKYDYYTPCSAQNLRFSIEIFLSVERLIATWMKLPMVLSELT